MATTCSNYPLPDAVAIQVHTGDGLAMAESSPTHTHMYLNPIFWRFASVSTRSGTLKFIHDVFGLRRGVPRLLLGDDVTR